MNRNHLLILLLLPSTTQAQHLEKYYDYHNHYVKPDLAFYYCVMDKKDSVWERKDYYIFNRQMALQGYFLDTACKIAKGLFIYYHLNGNLKASGNIVNGKKEGLWLWYHHNGMMEDSSAYKKGNIIGTSFKWHTNGVLSDSSVYNEDGSGTSVTWFDNGAVSSAGRYSSGYKKYGKWQYFHKNGKPASIEIYKDDVLIDKHYFNELGNAIADTTNKDKIAHYKAGNGGWSYYLMNQLYTTVSGSGYENMDKSFIILSATIDEDGRMTDVDVHTIGHPEFDSKVENVVLRCPKWVPSISHNRRVKYRFTDAMHFFSQ